MSLIKPILGAALLAMACPGPASAQEEQTIVISACRAEQEQFEAVRSVELMDRGQLEECQVRSVPEAVDQLTGVHLQQTNRGAGAPFIRGLTGPQNLILVDGIRFNTSTFRTGPNQYLALIDPFALDRLEVLRGPSSVLYGNGAMGGVIQLLTPALNPGCSDPEEFGQIHGRLEGLMSSADNARGASLQLTSDTENAAFLAGASLNQFGLLRAGGGADQPLSDYFSGFWHLKYNTQGHPDLLISVNYLGAAVLDAGRTDQAGLGDLRFYDNRDHLAYVILHYSGFEFLKRTRLSLSYHRLAEDVERYSCARDETGVVADLQQCLGLDSRTVTRRRRYHDTVDILGADLNIGTDLWERRIRVNSGLELYQEYVGSDMLQDGEKRRGNFSDESDYLSFGAFLHADLTLLDLGPETGELRVHGGLRLSHFNAAAPEVPGVGDVEYEYSGLVGTGGIQFLRPGLFNLYATFVQGFRAPNLQESTTAGDTGSRFEVPNPDLRPERSETMEIGGRMALDPLEFYAAYFYSMMKDAMTWQAASFEGQAEIDGKPVTTVVNSSDGVFQGAEAGLSASYWLLRLKLGLSWMQGDLDLPEGTSSPARRIPPLIGAAGLRLTEPGRQAFIELRVRFAGRQDRLHPQDQADLRICESGPFSGRLQDTCDGTHGWVTLDFRGSLRLSDTTRLHISVRNLTDANYRNHGSGLDAPGIDARLNLIAEF